MNTQNNKGGCSVDSSKSEANVNKMTGANFANNASAPNESRAKMNTNSSSIGGAGGTNANNASINNASAKTHGGGCKVTPSSCNTGCNSNK